MKLKAAVLAGISGILSCFISFRINYVYLLDHQPPNAPGAQWPENVTSFPPSAAWLPAITWGVFTFVGVFFASVAVLRFRSRQPRRTKP
jgi:hypothetical protein